MTVAHDLREIAGSLALAGADLEPTAMELLTLATKLDEKARELRDACERTIGIYDHAMDVAASLGGDRVLTEVKEHA